MTQEEKIKLAQLEQQLHVIKSTNPSRYNAIMKSYDEICVFKENRELFKSFSADLKAKHPNGGWRTINGAHVFIAGGKVIAGLDGFNKHIDELHSKKKEGVKSGNDSLPKSKDGLYQIYKIKVRKGGEVVEMFGVPSVDNKGVRGAGDDVFESLSEAEDQVKYNRTTGEELQKKREQQELDYKQSKEKEEAEKQKRKEDNKGKTKLEIMNEAKDAKTLSQKISINGSVKTRKEHVDDILGSGGHIETAQVNKIKDLSRRAYNRMDGHQQDAFDKKQKEAGKKTEYRLFTKDGSFFTVTKAEYEYAKSKQQSNPSTPTNERSQKEHAFSVTVDGKKYYAKKTKGQNKYSAFDEDGNRLNEGLHSSKRDFEELVKDGIRKKKRDDKLDKKDNKLNALSEVNKKLDKFKKDAEKNKDTSITLDTFKDIAKQSKGVDDFMSKVREIKNVPPEVAKEFGEKYGGEGSTPRSASEKFLKEHKESNNVYTQTKDFSQKMFSVIPNNLKNRSEFLNKLETFVMYDGLRDGVKKDIISPEEKSVFDKMETLLNNSKLPQKVIEKVFRASINNKQKAKFNNRIDAYLDEQQNM